MSKAAIAYIAHDDHYFLGASIASFTCGLPIIVFVSEVSWTGDAGDWHRAEKIALAAGARVVSGHWASEKEHRDAAYEQLRKEGYGYVLVPDGDEIIEPKLLDTLLTIAQNGVADRVYIEWDTYFMDTEHVVRPREPFKPIIMANLNAATYEKTRDWSGGRPLQLDGSYDYIHHLSYAGPDERIRRKVTTWGHRNEVREDWLETVWERFPHDKSIRNLHPTHPNHYAFVEHIQTPPTLARCLELGRGFGDYDPKEEHEPLSNDFVEPISNGVMEKEEPAYEPRSKVSVVIPLCGGEDDVRQCLESLGNIQDLIHEVIVVDNGSKDDAAQVATSFDFAKVEELGENKGFAAACNEGIKLSTGDVVLLLNSDTFMPRAGLIELLESLESSATIAAAGPLTNSAGYGQSVPVTYTKPETIELFATDFAARQAQDRDTDMLVGFCMAVRRSALNEVGLLDETFGIGTYEDNDLCYRLRRAGYRLVLAGKSFVHHGGSKTLGRLGVDLRVLMERNGARYHKKWARDLECGYASHLSGMSTEPIVFNSDNRPETKLKAIRFTAKQASISLCMIARDEERVIRDCLESAKPFFKEIIVVDTGSTDRTKEIALDCGAKVFDFPWTDSFSEARNESLKHATGKWIFWMDADDTLPFECGLTLQANAMNSPKVIAGFVVPVRFTDDGPVGGVRVDHVKLFRNLPGVQFEFHIHEQILHSLRDKGEIARSAAYVLHSGYDTSEEGQAKKHIRDAKLLDLDLKADPNNPFTLFNIGMTAHYTDDHPTALDYLRQSLALAGERDSQVRKAYALLVGSLLKKEKDDEAEETLNEALAKFPDDPEINFLVAKDLGRKGKHKEAKEAYDHVLEADISNVFTSIDQGILGFKTRHNRAEMHLYLGDYEAAKADWLAALDEAPYFAASIAMLFQASLAVRDLSTARYMMDRMRALTGYGKDWTLMATSYGELVGGPDGALELLVKAFESNPRDAIEPRMEFARRMLAAGKDDLAAQHLLQLQGIGLAEAAFVLGALDTTHRRFRSALNWMHRALELNPGHEETMKHIATLEELMGLREKAEDLVGVGAAQVQEDSGTTVEPLESQP